MERKRWMRCPDGRIQQRVPDDRWVMDPRTQTSVRGSGIVDAKKPATRATGETRRRGCDKDCVRMEPLSTCFLLSYTPPAARASGAGRGRRRPLPQPRRGSSTPPPAQVPGRACGRRGAGGIQPDGRFRNGFGSPPGIEFGGGRPAPGTRPGSRPRGASRRVRPMVAPAARGSRETGRDATAPRAVPSCPAGPFRRGACYLPRHGRAPSRLPRGASTRLHAAR